MIRWTFGLFIIAALSSVIWWPGHFDAEHFTNLSTEEITRSLQHLPETISRRGLELAEKISLDLATLFPNPEALEATESEVKDGFERLASAPYWLAMKSLLATAVVRLSLAFAWFVLLTPLLIGTVIDALIVRKLRYESFACTHPTVYRAALLAPALLLCLATLAILAPLPLRMILPALFYLGFLFSIHTLVAHFHKFG